MNILEITGFVFGIAGIWLTIREHWSCFPVGLVNVTVSMFLFFNQKLYSDTLQQVVYVVLLSYGWYQWSRGLPGRRPAIGFMSIKTKIYMFFIFIITSISIGCFFKQYTDADVPYLDATATCLSFIAQYLIARKKIENWLIWFTVNILYIGIYSYKELYLYAVLFTIYLLLSIKGYLEWKAVLMKQQRIALHG